MLNGHALDRDGRATSDYYTQALAKQGHANKQLTILSDIDYIHCSVVETAQGRRSQAVVLKKAQAKLMRQGSELVESMSPHAQNDRHTKGG